MAMLVVAAAASWLGGAVGGAIGYAAIGSSIGWAVGSMLYQSSQTVRNKGPLSDDLSAPKLQYGTRLPRTYGRVRCSGAPAWMSRKRAIANTTSQGGKGGPKVESTTYTYEVDALFVVKIEDPLVLAVTRVWLNGQVVYSVLSDSDAETIETSLNSEAWESITLFDGNPSQMPWSIYEADVGTEDALAYRRRTTIGIAALNLGGSDQVPLVEFEIITAGTSQPADANTLLLAPLTESGEDVSFYERSDEVVGTPVFSTMDFDPDSGMLTGTSDHVQYLDDPMTCPEDGLTVECWSRWTGLVGSGGGEAQQIWGMIVGGVLDSMRLCWITSDGNYRIVSGDASPSLGPLPLGSWNHFAVTFSDDSFSPEVRIFENGVLVTEYTLGLGLSATWPTFTFDVGDYSHTEDALVSYRVQDVRVRRGVRYTSSFTPPPRGSLVADASGLIWSPTSVDLAEIVAAETDLAGLGGSSIDVTELAGIEVTGYAPTGSARAAIEPLMAAYYFEASCSDKLYFPVRGAPIAATLPYDDLAAGNDEAGESAFDPVRANLEEIPAKVMLTYMNLSADYEAGSEMGDRLVGPGQRYEQVSLPLVLTPPEAKGRALAMVMDSLASATSATISITDEYAEIEPTDALIVTDRNGTRRRMRVVRETYARGVKQLELVADDPSALVSTGLTMDESVPVISVPAPRTTMVDLLDIPLLMDNYDVPGFMAAFYPNQADGWPGGTLFRSLDGSSYSQVVTATERATRGTASELGDWTAGRVFDEINTVTVAVNGTLSSATRAALYADRQLNVAAIGAHGRWEIIRFRDATLVEAGVYTLSGLIRGCLGTEWAAGTHEEDDLFVVLQPAGLRRVNHTTGDIGLERLYKAVTLGRSLATATPQAFTDTGVNLKPLSPVDPRALRSGDDLTLTWRRRTRYQTRHFGPLPESVPLGESVEAYSVDILDTGVVVGTLASTAPSLTFDVTDFGLTPGDPVEVAIHQISASVGRGYALEATV
jgi:hypothetical protein